MSKEYLTIHQVARLKRQEVAVMTPRAIDGSFPFTPKRVGVGSSLDNDTRQKHLVDLAFGDIDSTTGRRVAEFIATIEGWPTTEITD